MEKRHDSELFKFTYATPDFSDIAECEIRIKYFDKNMEKIKKIEQGDWIDLRSAEDVDMKAGEHRYISLGIAMELPEGYEAIVAPRSSTYKNFGIICANSIGIIDHSYRGDNDVWHFSAIALRDTHISKYDRICQFRIQKRMPLVLFNEVDKLDNPDRGGHGTTGIK